jgi:arsenate reductase-like glutaredoxin family protein
MSKMKRQVDWYYRRNNCVTCSRADAFLEDCGAAITEQVDARKQRKTPDEAVQLARSVKHLYVAKGKKVVHLDMGAESPSDAELKKLLVGPSGNLRAPTALAGDRMFVGFHPEEFVAGLWGK